MSAPTDDVLEELDATDLAQAHADGERSVRDTVEEALEQITLLGPALGAFAEVLADTARATADRQDAALEHGFPAGPLCGVPVVLKGNLCLAGVEANCGSRLLAGWRPPYSATAVERLLEAGAVPVAIAHMDEFAMGSSGENSAFSAARNPWDLERAPGGSSSGSAVAVAAGCAPLALGSDTGGSVRQPAALCGVSGFKPSYGRLSRYGLVAFGSSLDQIGPIARSARDLELVMEAVSGPDERDATCSHEAPFRRRERSLEGLRLGVPREYMDAGIDARVRSSIEVALTEMEAAGAVRVALDLPTTEAAVACYYVLAAAEAASNLARFDGVRYGRREPGDGSLAGMQAATRGRGFGTEVKRRILLGTFVLSHGYYDAWYRRAQGVRASIAAELGAAFQHVDLIVGPTCPEPAFRLGEKSTDPLALYRTDALTVPASLAGLPAVSVPVRCAPVGELELPVGLQLVGPRGGDADVLAAAAAFQRVSAHHRRRPPREPQA